MAQSFWAERGARPEQEEGPKGAVGCWQVSWSRTQQAATPGEAHPTPARPKEQSEPEGASAPGPVRRCNPCSRPGLCVAILVTATITGPCHQRPCRGHLCIPNAKPNSSFHDTLQPETWKAHTRRRHRRKRTLPASVLKHQRRGLSAAAPSELWDLFFCYTGSKKHRPVWLLQQAKQKLITATWTCHD